MRLSGKLQLLVLMITVLCIINLLKLIFDFMLQRRAQPDFSFIPQDRPKPRFSKLSSDLFIFSSFVDARDGNMGFPFFRIIAVMRTYRQHKYYCIFKNDRVQAQIYAMAENHGRLYGSHILNCRIPARFLITVSKIKLTDGNNTLELTPTYYIPPENSLTSFAHNYAVCLPFLYGYFYSAEYMIEAVEMHKLLGAQQITLYTLRRNLDDDVLKALRYYETEGILDVINFEQPVADIWNHAQLVAINDCLYRNMGRAKFVSFQDWDEFVIPIENIDLPSLFEEVFFNSSVASYRIATIYIHLNQNYPSLINSVQGENEKLDREFTKCVLRPEMVFEQGIHHTSRVIQDQYLALKLPSTEAVLHHYVEYTFPQTSPVTTIPFRYGKQLLQNCDTVLRRIYEH